MMNGPEKNKMMTAENASKKADPVMEDFFFPQYQKTITAATREEAEEKLKALLKKEK